jgi:hypothetical protein
MLVRSEAGEQLVNESLNSNLIVTSDFPSDREAILRKAVSGKKQRVIKELSERGSEASPLLYLKMDDDRRKLFLEGGPK